MEKQHIWLLRDLATNSILDASMERSDILSQYMSTQNSYVDIYLIY